MTTQTQYPTQVTEEKYAKPKKACHCGPESPCKKDGICRCKLADRLRVASLESKLPPALAIEQNFEREYDATHPGERSPQHPSAYDLRKHDYVNEEIVLLIVGDGQ